MRIMSPISADQVDPRFRCGPVEFANPVFTASGAWGYGIEYLDLVDASRLGGIVTKTITVEPRSGNPQPRVRELRHGILNSIGLENVGLESFVRDKLPVLRENGIATVVSLAARDESEFVTMIAELSRHDGWKAVELNLSCPNVARGGLDFGRDRDQVERITALASESLPDDRALWVKLTPNVTSIGDLAAGAEAGGDFLQQLSALFEGVGARDYLALQAFLPATDAVQEALLELRAQLAIRLGRPVTLGVGPRFLHSTGQFHKGGPATGVFLQLTHTPVATLAIPGESFSFETLFEAQAAGDLAALWARGRRALRVDLGRGQPALALATLGALLRSA